MRRHLSAAFLLAVLMVNCVSPAQAAENDAPLVHSVLASSNSVPNAEWLTAGMGDEGKSLSISTTTSGAAVSIDLGSLPVQPKMIYRARFAVDATAIKDVAGVSLMIREHSAEGVAPFKPYHRTAVNVRPLAPGESSSRELIITAGARTHALSVAIVVTEL